MDRCGWTGRVGVDTVRDGHDRGEGGYHGVAACVRLHSFPMRCGMRLMC